MDRQLEKREFRLKIASAKRNTGMQWDLVAAATEQANIDYHGLTGIEAKKMRGRSKVTFQMVEKNPLEMDDIRKDNNDLLTRADWLNKIAGQQ